MTEKLSLDKSLLPTPRTDEAAARCMPADKRADYSVVPADFARQLEQELAVAKAETERRVEWMRQATIDRIRNGVNP